MQRLIQHNFGLFLDLDWEYPETEIDRRIFSVLVRQYRVEFQNEASLTNRTRLLLTASVAAYQLEIEAGYDIQEIAPFLDYIGFNSPLYPRSTETDDQRLLNQQATVNTWIDGGCPSSKLVLGLGMYGRTFRLKQKKNPKHHRKVLVYLVIIPVLVDFYPIMKYVM